MIRYLEDDFDKVIEKGRILVDFYADWCGPCRMMGEILEDIKEIEILKVNVDKFPLIAQRYGIISVPSLMLFQEGKIVKSNVGFLDKESLLEFIK